MSIKQVQVGDSIYLINTDLLRFDFGSRDHWMDAARYAGASIDKMFIDDYDVDHWRDSLRYAIKATAPKKKPFLTTIKEKLPMIFVSKIFKKSFPTIHDWITKLDERIGEEREYRREADGVLSEKIFQVNKRINLMEETEKKLITKLDDIAKLLKYDPASSHYMAMWGRSFVASPSLTILGNKITEVTTPAKVEVKATKVKGAKRK